MGYFCVPAGWPRLDVYGGMDNDQGMLCVVCVLCSV